MKSIFYLKTCDTCKRILDQLNTSGFELREIKSHPITERELGELRGRVNSYEELLNKRAVYYREKGLKNQNLTDDEIKNLILQEYTLLKRPVVIDENSFFAGNSKKVIEELKEAYGKWSFMRLIKPVDNEPAFWSLFSH